MSKRVLMTGANGFIGQHMLHQFLSAGHSVRAVVRTQAKADQLAASLRALAGPARLDFGIVPDMTAPGAFDSVLTSSEPPFDVVVHSASPFNYRKASSNADFLEPAVKGTSEILEAIVRLAPTVKRVVLTSSMAAVVDFAAPKVTSPKKVYSERDWNPTSWETALSTSVQNTAYQASKKFAELAAWDVVGGKNASGKKPGFDLVTVNPPMVYGPVFDADAVAQPKDLNQSTWLLYASFMRPNGSSSDPIPPAALHLYVDVRDVARAHLLAATIPEAGGRRFILCKGGISNQRIANLFREALPEMEGRIPRGKPERDALEEGMFEADSSSIKEVLGLEFRTEEETFRDVALQLAEIDKRRSD